MKEIEQLYTPEGHDGFNQEMLEKVIRRAWGDVHVVNLDKLKGPNIKALFTFCPLYQPGSLENSKVMYPPFSISESRVGNKWIALRKSISAVNEYLTGIDGKLELVSVFANKGVMLGQNPIGEDYTALEQHKEAYESVLSDFCIQQNIDYQFFSYDELGVKFPTFVDPKAGIPCCGNTVYERGNMSWLIETINSFLLEHKIPTVVKDNKKNRVLLSKFHEIG